MAKEIENKYALKYFPENLPIEEQKELEQAYIYCDKFTTIRIRKENSSNKENIKYIYTIKEKIAKEKNTETNVKEEIEHELTKEEYEKLLSKKISNKIEKTRYVIKISNTLKAEIDIYKGVLEGIRNVEVEFKTEEEALEFQKPEWFGKILKGKEFSNRKLAELNKEEIIQMKNKIKELEN